jgi:hypothetical protein
VAAMITRADIVKILFITRDLSEEFIYSSFLSHIYFKEQHGKI